MRATSRYDLCPMIVLTADVLQPSCLPLPLFFEAMIGLFVRFFFNKHKQMNFIIRYASLPKRRRLANVLRQPRHKSPESSVQLHITSRSASGSDRMSSPSVPSVTVQLLLLLLQIYRILRSKSIFCIIP